MDRRKFLVGASRFAVVVLALSSWSGRAIAGLDPRGLVAHDGRLFRCGRRGRILESRDRGSSWSVAADFGPTRPILGLGRAEGQLCAEVGYRHVRFPLRSRDGIAWYPLS